MKAYTLAVTIVFVPVVAVLACRDPTGTLLAASVMLALGTCLPQRPERRMSRAAARPGEDRSHVPARPIRMGVSNGRRQSDAATTAALGFFQQGVSLRNTEQKGEAMEWHPYAKLFPMLPEAELHKLADDIRDNGQRYPIIVDSDDRIIDGRNRALACEIAGVEPVIEARDFTDREALAFVVSTNLHRRHLTESQRADIAAKIANTKVGKPKSNSANLPNNDTAVTQAEAAELMNVSTRSVTAAKKVHEHGTPELQAALSSGEVKVSRAAKIADLPKSQQAQAIIEKHRRAEPEEDDSELDLLSESSNTTGDILKEIAAIAKHVSALSKAKAGAFVNVALVKRTLRELRQELQRAVLAQPCKDCNGKGCMLCKDVGYVTAGHYDG